MQKTVLIPVLLAAAAWAALAWRRYRSRSPEAQMKEQVQTWESEGGNVPEVVAVNPGTSPRDGDRD